jgi:curved DNA-binding protein
MKYKDYYAVLGISRDADLDQIKKAYRKLARAHHPDMSKAVDAESKFKEAVEAYATLKNPEERAAYDAFGQSKVGSNFSPPPQWRDQYTGSETQFDEMDLADLLASLGRRSGNPNTRDHSIAGRDFQDVVQITLNDALQGTNLKLKLMDNGKERELEVRIPAGVNQGKKIRLRGMGGKGFNGGVDGDIYLHVELKPHPLFKPVGIDLYFELALAPWEAVLGSELEMPTLEGSVMLTVPIGTRHGQKLRIKGRGLSEGQGARGDLFAVVHIETPNEVSPEELKLFQELSLASKFNPRKTVS